MKLFKIHPKIIQTLNFYDENFNHFLLIDVPYDLIKDNPTTFFDNYDGDLPSDNDDIKGIIFLISMSDFCAFDNITKKNKFASTMEYCHKILNIERFKSSVFTFKLTKGDIFYDNIMNGYSMSNCFDEELHAKYVNSKGQNYFKIWDKTKDKVGNLQLITHIIPGFIRKYCIDKETVVFWNDCIAIINRFVGLLFEYKNETVKEKNWSLIKDAQEVITSGIINMTHMANREMLLYCSTNPGQLMDWRENEDFIKSVQNNVLSAWKKDK